MLQQNHITFLHLVVFQQMFSFSGLVLWDSIEPTEEWVESQVPDTIKPYCFVKPTEDNIDYEAMK